MGVVRRLAIVYPHLEAEVDGIRDHCHRLSEALADRGVDVSLHRSLGEVRLGETPADPDVVLIEYMPFAYGRWGVAPSLPAAARRMRWRAPRPLMALMVHEMYVPLQGAGNVAMGVWQRLQLLALATTMDVLYGSIEAWVRAMRAAPVRRRVEHLPVGSNLPDMRAARCAQRARLGAGPDTLVLATFGSDHPSHLSGHVRAAVNAVASSGADTTYLNLGADPFRVDGLDPAIRLLAPGHEAARALAAKLAAADLFLAARTDGVSTRRGSLMAAIQHGVPTVATDGAHTDSGLGCGLALVRDSDPQEFADAARSLALDAAARDALGRRGRLLYERRFDWAVLAERLHVSLQAMIDRRVHYRAARR